MVGYYQAYKGSTHTPLIYHGNKLVKKVYHGSTLVYQIGFNPVRFDYTGSLQTFHIPLGIDKIKIECVGASGARTAGKGGRVVTDLSVTPDTDIYVWVGKQHAEGNISEYNASDVRTSNTSVLSQTGLESRLVVAGGGGTGGTGNSSTRGGNGGGLVGEDGVSSFPSNGGKGGTQSTGGAGGDVTPWTSQQGANGIAGQLGLGGAGVNSSYGFGGSGGAGYYGGGSGSGVNTKSYGYMGSGGGGGSSYTDSVLCSNVQHTQGFQDGNGYVIISVA